ncbi:putative phage tail protein [Gluconacetobacter diazotrophicus]|uniref:putative phage tail protein n=1 Tax=Gluconacetobacter diazotrophicus TaxID=33996 RepID=UPI000173B377|nr:putative phage tail protein [Gluconacetobacter diazotrophicus]
MANFTQEQYNQLIMQLLPNGPAWPKTPDTVQYQIMTSLMSQLWQLDDDATNLISDLNPGTTINFINEWQETFGLPDSCITETLTTEQEIQQILNRFTEVGGITADFYKSLASEYGYSIEVVEYGPFVCGLTELGDTAYMDGDDSVGFAVTLIENTSQDLTLLQCKFSRLSTLLACIDFYLYQPATNTQIVL